MLYQSIWLNYTKLSYHKIQNDTIFIWYDSNIIFIKINKNLYYRIKILNFVSYYIILYWINSTCSNARIKGDNLINQLSGILISPL